MTSLFILHPDSLVRQHLRHLAAACGRPCAVAGEAGSAAEAAALLPLHPSPDLLLLHTDLPDGSGFDFLDAFPDPSFQVVFTSERQDFALRAFQYNALDYLLLPAGEQEFCRALAKVRGGGDSSASLARQFQMLFRGAQPRHLDKLVLHLSEGIHVLPLADIVRLESDGCYTTFFTSHGERIVVTKSIGEYEHLTASGEQFFRVHQSHLVNLNFVRKVLREDGGCAVLDGGARIPVARRRKEEFLRALGG